MDKLDMQSKNLVDENISKIAELFPNCITEGKNEEGQVVKLVDFDLLKQELSKEIVEGNDERYTLNWAGKKQAILTANSPINATLRPCREESVDFDNTKNLYIEGDNLDVLKLLRETYLGKVKMIYIDPPYNTGNDFVYEDDFATSAEDYLQASKSYDEQGNRMFQNNDSNGRFHSDWLSMMYTRLKIAKDLLTDDGVIFISIDDNEVDNLKKLSVEIFGERNFLACLIWNKQHSQQQGVFKRYHESVLVLAKNSNFIKNIQCGSGLIEAGALKKISKANPESTFTFPAGTRFDAPDGTELTGTYGESETVTVVEGRMIAENGKLKEDVVLSAGWTQKNQMTAYFKGEKVIDSKGQNVIEFFFNSTGKLKCIKERSSITPPSILPLYGMVSEQSEKLNKLMEANVFDNPKPVAMIKDFTEWFTKKDDLILDFFSGSGTTAHSVMEMNTEDGGNRRFIMVQIPEDCDEKSEAYRAGYKNICEIGKERIRRAGKKIKEENKDCNIDAGFRVLKLDNSNMKDIYYKPAELNQATLMDYVSNIKEDRTPEDLLFQVMLDMGVMLSSEIITIDIIGKKVFNVNDGNLVCCFDDNLTDEVVTEIAKMQPLYAVFRDSSMSSDSVAVNFDQIFETYSPTTTRKVL